jgi:hypothetical protein
MKTATTAPTMATTTTTARTDLARRRNEGPVTDRALRYRANADPPPGEKRCTFCGSVRNVEVGHVDGHAENTSAENLVWTCRRCNTQMGAVFKRAGIGRRTRQFNPGAQSLGQWLVAVTS